MKRDTASTELQANGHVPDGGYKSEIDLTRVTTERFCDVAREYSDTFQVYFQRVFENKTFRVFRVL